MKSNKFEDVDKWVTLSDELNEYLSYLDNEAHHRSLLFLGFDKGSRIDSGGFTKRARELQVVAEEPLRSWLAIDGHTLATFSWVIAAFCGCITSREVKEVVLKKIAEVEMQNETIH